MRIPIDELLLKCLSQEIPESYRFYRSKEKAYEQLKHLTGQDFGYDIAAWEKWFRNAENPFPNLKKPME